MFDDDADGIADFLISFESIALLWAAKSVIVAHQETIHGKGLQEQFAHEL